MYHKKIGRFSVSLHANGTMLFEIGDAMASWATRTEALTAEEVRDLHYMLVGAMRELFPREPPPSTS